jgi:hypothetical protein
MATHGRNGAPVHRKKGARVIARMRAATEPLEMAREEECATDRRRQIVSRLTRSPERLGKFRQEVRLDDEGEIINTPVLLA